VLVQSGARQFEAVAQQLPHNIAATELYDYAQRHPRAFHTITKWLIGQDVDGSPDSYRQLAAAVPIVALRARR
jgi:hypothetical protein